MLKSTFISLKFIKYSLLVCVSFDITAVLFAKCLGIQSPNDPPKRHYYLFLLYFNFLFCVGCFGWLCTVHLLVNK